MAHSLIKGMSIACIALSIGCASAPKTPSAKSFEPPPLPSSCAYELVRVYDSKLVSLEEVVAQAAKSRVVLIGEYHEQPDGQCFESAFFRALVAAAPKAMSALEFFERDEQVHLDDFLAGLTDEAAFMKASARASGNYSPAHRDIILASKEFARPVVAANAPRRYVRLARTKGFDFLEKLGAEQTRLFTIPKIEPTAAYRDRFLDLMAPKDESGVRKDVENAEQMFRSQTMWDATMADSVVQSLKASKGEPVVLIVGAFHVDDEGATAQFVRAGAPEAATVVIVMKYSDETIEPGCADFVVKLSESRPK